MRSLLQACFIAAATLAAVPAHADIALGHIVPLTGGPATTGRELAQGAKAYIDKVNAEGGIAGHKIVYVLRDDENKPELTIARAAEVLKSTKVVGFLPGAEPHNVKSLVSSGLLWQNGAVIVAVRNGMANAPSLINAAEGSTREAGLIEVTAPPGYYAPLIEEFRTSLAKFGPTDATFSHTGLQGYMAAKVMVNAVRMLSENSRSEGAIRADYREVMQRMYPDMSSRLIASDAPK